MALAGVGIEQDAAYWEWHIKVSEGSKSEDIKFGVATKKNAAFYKSLDEQSGDGASNVCGGCSTKTSAKVGAERLTLTLLLLLS